MPNDYKGLALMTFQFSLLKAVGQQLPDVRPALSAHLFAQAAAAGTVPVALLALLLLVTSQLPLHVHMVDGLCTQGTSHFCIGWYLHKHNIAQVAQPVMFKTTKGEPNLYKSCLTRTLASAGLHTGNG